MRCGEAVADAEPVVAIPKGAVAWMPKPVYVLHWERNGELFFDRLLDYQTPPERRAHCSRGAACARSCSTSRCRCRPMGRSAMRRVDAWIRAGQARVRAEPHVLRARDGRVWVTIDLLDEPAAARR